MSEIIVENSLYTNDQEKEDFVSDRQRVASAFFINLFGMIGLFSFSSKRGLMKTYFADDKFLRLTTITDENKDLSLLVKLYHDVGGMQQSTADKLTRMLVKMKQKTLTSKNFDEALFREIVSEIKYNIVRPHPILIPIIKGYIDGEYQAVNVAKEMFYLVKTRKKEFMKLSQEYYTIAKQYIAVMGNVPRINQVTSTPASTNPSAIVAQSQVQQPVAQTTTTVATAQPNPTIPDPATVTDPVATGASIPDQSTTATPAVEDAAYNAAVDALRDISSNAALESSKSNIDPTVKASWEAIAAQATKEMIALVGTSLPDRSTQLQMTNRTISELEALVVAVRQLIDRQAAAASAATVAPAASMGAGSRKKAAPVATIEFSTLFTKVLEIGASAEITKVVKESKVNADEFRQYVINVTRGQVDQVSKQFMDAYVADMDKVTEGLLKWAFRGQGVKAEMFPYILAEYNHEVFYKMGAKGIVVDMKKFIKRINEKNSHAAYYALTKFLTDTGGIDWHVISNLKSTFNQLIQNDTGNKLIMASIAYWYRHDVPMFEKAIMLFNKILHLDGENFRKELGFKHGGWHDEFQGKFSDKFTEEAASIGLVYGLLFAKRKSTDWGNARQTMETYNSPLTILPLLDIEDSIEGCKEFLATDNGKIYYNALNGGLDIRADPVYLKSKSIYNMVKAMDEMYSLASSPTYRGAIGAAVINAFEKPNEVTINFSRVILDFNNFSRLYGEEYLLSEAVLDKLFDMGENTINSYLYLFSMKKVLKVVKPTSDKVANGLFIAGIYTKETLKNAKFETVESAMKIVMKPFAVELLSEEQKRDMGKQMSNGGFARLLTSGNTNNAGLSKSLNLLDGYIQINQALMEVISQSVVLGKCPRNLNMHKTYFDYLDNGGSPSKAVQGLMDQYVFLSEDMSKKLAGIVKERITDDLLKCIFAKYLSPQDADDVFATVDDNYVKVELLKREYIRTRQLSAAIKQIVESPVIYEHPVNADRMAAALRYNNVAVPDSYEEGKPLVDCLVPFQLQELAIAPTEMSQTELDEISVRLQGMENRRHGDVSLKVLEVFDVNIPVQSELLAQKIDELNAEGQSINEEIPMFHGCGPIAANMILRYGFTVLPSNDPSVAGAMLGQGVYFTNVVDKASQYVKNDFNDSAVNRNLGTIGYFFELETILGKNKRDSTFGKQGARFYGRALISNEWCAHDYKRMIVIKKAYRVQKVHRGEIENLAEGFNPEYNGIKSFNDMLVEAESQRKPKMKLLVNLIRGVVTEDMVAKFGKNVEIGSWNSFVINNDEFDGEFNIPNDEFLTLEQMDALLSGDVSVAKPFFDDLEDEDEED